MDGDLSFHLEKGAMYYDGRGHPVGRLDGLIRDGVLIITDNIRGNVYQFPLVAITEVKPRTGLLEPKAVELATGRTAITLYCENKQQVREVAALIATAMRGG